MEEQESASWVCSVPSCTRHSGVQRDGVMFCSFHHGTERPDWKAISEAMEEFKPEIRLHDKAIRWPGRERDNYGGEVKLYKYPELIRMVHDGASEIAMGGAPLSNRYQSDDGLWGQDHASQSHN